jgi:L-amino acid N-acyltransferase YncA
MNLKRGCLYENGASPFKEKGKGIFMSISLKSITKENQKAIMDIFNYYIEHSFAAYPEKRLPYEFFDKLLQMSLGYPAIIAEDENGTVLGYGMLRAFNPLPTFSQTAEISYFLRPESTGKGIGQIMLEHLIQKGKQEGLISILASISSLNEGSIRFHKKNGFLECGRFKNICLKLGKLFDVVYMQKMLE